MRNTYYAIKRQAMRLVCLTGRHDYRFGLFAKDGRQGACLRCRKYLAKRGDKR